MFYNLSWQDVKPSSKHKENDYKRAKHYDSQSTRACWLYQDYIFGLCGPDWSRSIAFIQVQMCSAYQTPGWWS